jgi:hypothetical protein
MDNTTASRPAFDVDHLDDAMLEPPVLRIGQSGQHHVLVAEQFDIGDVELRWGGEVVAMRDATIVTAPNRRQWIVGLDLGRALRAAMLRDPFHAAIHP